MLIKAQALATTDQICDLGSLEASGFCCCFVFVFILLLLFLLYNGIQTTYSEGYGEEKKKAESIFSRL